MSYLFATWLILCLTIVHDSIAQQPADKSANAKTKQILAYIADLPKQGKMLSGQFAGYSPDTFSTNLIDQISSQTGKVPAILGCDWACGWNSRSPPENIIDYSCNPALKAHWNKGGLVTVNMHLPNPSSSNGGGYKDRGSLNFADLINTNTETGKRWYRFLDRMAQGLDDLQRAGVTVLFRPLHEMNGDWFYWCNQDPELFKNVWKQMFNYLTTTKQIHNTLWIYSPDQSRSGWTRYYPGDAYVDIVALDVYTDDPNSMNGYNDMLSLNKPFALGEVGPGTTNGQFDYTRWINTVQNRFPRVTYFLAWNDGWSPIRNVNAYAFFNHPRVINRGEISFGNVVSTTASSISSVLYSFSQGVGQWKGSNLAGGPWQTNEFISKGLNSLKGDVRLSAGQRYSFFTQDPTAMKINGKRRLTGEVRAASWGFSKGGTISAKLYLKGGAGWQWYDSGAVQLSSGNSQSLAFDLSKVSATHLADVKEIGVEFTSNTNGAQTSVYLSSLSVES